ncbi:MAG: hypothetical protein IJN34_01600, partial [Clostridia bacterium]|nr:hypothetical protein [Clostridia bacterium]
ANRSQINGDNFRRLMAKINIGIASPSAEEGEVRFDTASSGKTVVYKDGFAHATVEKLIVTDKNGTEFQNTSLGFRDPVITANSLRVMVYDSGGTGLVVADSFSVLYEKQMENPIITAKMNANGSIVVVTEGEGYLAKVYVFDSSMKEVYRYRSLNRYILDAAISKDGKALAVSALNIEGSDILPEILYFKLNKEEIEWTASFSESPCVRIAIKDNGSVCGMFDWGMVSLNKKGNEQGRFLLDNRALQCYSLEDGVSNIFVVSAADNGAGTIVICNEKGKEKDTINLDFYAVKLDYRDGRIAVLGNQKCGVYNRSGKELWSDQPERAEDIALMNRTTVVVVSETKCVYNKV